MPNKTRRVDVARSKLSVQDKPAILKHALHEVSEKGGYMLLLVATVEFAGCFAMGSVIAWLRHFSGQAIFADEKLLRYFMPIVAAFCVVVALSMAVQWARSGQQPKSAITVNLVLGCGVVLAVLVVWMVVEVRRFRAPT